MLKIRVIHVGFIWNTDTIKGSSFSSGKGWDWRVGRRVAVLAFGIGSQSFPVTGRSLKGRKQSLPTTLPYWPDFHFNVEMKGMRWMWPLLGVCCGVVWSWLDAWPSLLFSLLPPSGISDYAEIVEEEGDYSTPDGKRMIAIPFLAIQ